MSILELFCDVNDFCQLPFVYMLASVILVYNDIQRITVVHKRRHRHLRRHCRTVRQAFRLAISTSLTFDSLDLCDGDDELLLSRQSYKSYKSVVST